MNWREIVNKLYCALELEYRAVGVKIIKNEEDFKKDGSLELKSGMRYCQMLRSACKGKEIKAKSENFSCRSACRVMGIDKTDLKNSKGENWCRLGLYKDEKISQEVRKSILETEENNYGLVIKAIEKFEDCPDVIQIITNPYNIMRLVQAYAYHYGELKSVSLLGNQAICHESLARPYITQDVNISLLCIGTRHNSGWKKEDMAIGIPKNKIEKLVDGLWNTINIMEGNEEKKFIEEKAKKLGLDIDLRYNYNYYMDC